MDLGTHIATVASWLSTVQLDTVDQDIAQMHALVSFASATESEIIRAATHEAAHAVVAHRFGLRVKSAAIRADGSGVVQAEPLPLSFDALFAAIAIDMAGMFSELIQGADAQRVRCLQQSADLLQAARNIKRLSEMAPDLGLTHRAASAMSCAAVAANWGAIMRVAGALMACGELDDARIFALCAR